eukprot:4392736-Prymnesium_polylepis.1
MPLTSPARAVEACQHSFCCFSVQCTHHHPIRNYLKLILRDVVFQDGCLRRGGAAHRTELVSGTDSGDNARLHQGGRSATLAQVEGGSTDSHDCTLTSLWLEACCPTQGSGPVLTHTRETHSFFA